MSTRWMAVQFVGNTLRLPVVNEGDMDKPFGSSVIDREISRVVINPFSDSPQAFVSESEYVKLRELCRRYGEYLSQDRCEGCVCKTRCNNGLIDECWQLGEIRDLARELGMEVE